MTKVATGMKRDELESWQQKAMSLMGLQSLSGAQWFSGRVLDSRLRGRRF